MRVTNKTEIRLMDELAKERTREAANRTLNAWIRTSMPLIVFGFAIAKLYEYLEPLEHVFNWWRVVLWPTVVIAFQQELKVPVRSLLK